MIFNIANSLYIEATDLLYFGIEQAHIDYCTTLYTQSRLLGKPIKSWLTIQHPLLANQKIIKYNSLPCFYFKKYNLPSEEQLKQSTKKISHTKFEQIKDCENKIAKIKQSVSILRALK